MSGNSQAEVEVPEELRRRHDFLDLESGGYMAINRPADAPALTGTQEQAFRAVAAAAVAHVERERVDVVKPAQKAALLHMSKFTVIGRLYDEPADMLLSAPSGLYWLSPRGDLTRVETAPR